MPTFFPRQTVQIANFEEPGALRRLTFSLVEMAVITGVLLRIYRSLAMTHGSNGLLIILSFAAGLTFLFAMLTAHLANFTLKRWVTRAPLFVLVEVAAEAATSLMLIALGREPNGSVRAVMSDWLPMVSQTLLYRLVAVALWTLILAGAVTIVRRTGVAEPEDEASEDAMAEAMEARRSDHSGEQLLH